jgi:hypothetical protein
MPWRGPEYPGEFPTLGYEVAQWVQDHCVVPDREDAGQPFILTEEQLRFLVFHYAVDAATGRWRFERGSQLMRPKKWGKGPLMAAMICAEAVGPVLFDGWDAQGEPVGRPWATPLIQCAASSEDQVANVWRALLPMITLGALDAEMPDTGLTRVNLPNGGWIEPVTSSARSRAGARATFVVMDETWLWLESNGGHRLDLMLTDNLAGTGGRFVQTTNAYDPVEQSVAQRTFESKDPHVFKDDAPAPHGSVHNKRERDKVLDAVYGDSIRSQRNPRGWIDKERIHVEIDAKREQGDTATAEREFLNRKVAQEGAAFDPEAVKRNLRERFRPPDGDVIVIGLDGARTHDAFAAVATHAKTGFQWPLVIVERPDDAGDDYEHDVAEVNAALEEAFNRWNVWRMYCDPWKIAEWLNLWANNWGHRRVIEWNTNVMGKIGPAVKNYRAAVERGDMCHNGEERFVAHLRHARTKKLTKLDDDGKPLMTLAKVSIESREKIDAAMAAVLSWEARGDAIEAGAVWMGDESQPPEPPKPKPWAPGRALDTRVLQPASPVGPMGALS